MASTGGNHGTVSGGRDKGVPVGVVASVALHALLAVPVIFDLDLFGSRLEPTIAFAVGMVPLSELSAAPELGELTPPRLPELLELPAGNEAREVDTVDAEAPEQAPSAEPAPEASAPEIAEAPADDIPAETPLEVATAETPAPPPAPSAQADRPPAATQPDVAQPDTAVDEALPQPEVTPEPAAAPDSAAAPVTAPPPQSADSPQLAALEAPTLPQEPQPPAQRPDDAPTAPAPPLPPDQRTQARVRPEAEPDAPEVEPEEEDEEPPVEALTPPTPEPAPEAPEVAEVTVPPPPALVPQRERAPDPPAPPTAVVDNTAEPPERTSAIDSVLASLSDDSTAANTGQGTGRDAGAGGSSGSGVAASGARLTGGQLTASQEEALRGQLARCWLLPAGAAGVENMTVTIRAQMNPDRTVNGRAEIVDPQNRMGSDPAFRTFAESAYRAVMTCQPLLLPPDRAAEWSTLVLNFDPRNMF